MRQSLSSENASRLAAMQRADKNIDELLEDLNGAFHRTERHRSISRLTPNFGVPLSYKRMTDPASGQADECIAHPDSNDNDYQNADQLRNHRVDGELR